MTKIILFNGPPGSGKDFATQVIMREFAIDEPVHMKLSKPLKDLIMDHFNLTPLDLEEIKDQKTNEMASTLRDYQIAIFESIAKILGRQWLSISLINRAKKFDNSIIIISDVGRQEELHPIIKNFGAKNVLLIQLHRQGKTFNQDIRQYVDDPRVYSVLIKNDGTKDFETEILDEVNAFIAGEII